MVRSFGANTILALYLDPLGIEGLYRLYKVRGVVLGQLGWHVARVPQAAVLDSEWALVVALLASPSRPWPPE